MTGILGSQTCDGVSYFGQVLSSDGQHDDDPDGFGIVVTKNSEVVEGFLERKVIYAPFRTISETNYGVSQTIHLEGA